MTRTKPGHESETMTVTIKREFCEPSEVRRVFEVVENNGDRMVIREDRPRQWPSEIIPTELVRKSMVETV